MYRIIVLSTLALLAAPAFAQTTGAATIVGNVMDSSGAVIPAAKVTVVNTETNFHFDGLSNQDGYYFVPYLRPGIYNVTIEAAGFKRYVRDGLVVSAGERLGLDIELSIGQLTETINVSAKGVFFYLDRPIAEGCPLEVTLTFPPHVTLTESVKVRFIAKVVRVESPLPASRIGVAAMIEDYEFLKAVSGEVPIQ